MLLIAAPWHVLATLRNPPYFAFTMHSGPGEYHGFLWFFFINEQLLRFLNLRYPRDYNTVPRLWFWLFHLVWLFPWSVYLPAVAKLSFRPLDRAGRTRLLALCWIGFVLVFFTFSTTQEYYSMPCYPALALLLGSAMAAGGAWIRRGTRVAVRGGVRGGAGGAAFCCAGAPRSRSGRYFSRAETSSRRLHAVAGPHGRPDAGVVRLFAAAVAGGGGRVSDWRGGNAARNGHARVSGAALMMVIFFQAARLAMVVFDPYLSSRPLAEAMLESPEGKLIVDHHYYTFSSVFFYTNRTALLLNGRVNNLDYGSYAPGAPDVFIDDSQFKDLWHTPERYYMVANQPGAAAFARTGRLRAS